MNGSGGWVPIRVGLNDVNAYYDGTQVQIGHRQGTNEWIGAMDVVAHEFGHGIDDKTPGGISGGGTQEFVARHLRHRDRVLRQQPGRHSPDHTIGEEVNLVGQGPIRDSSNPANVGDPSCYTSSIPSSEVHAAAGPGDHWCYLLPTAAPPSATAPRHRRRRPDRDEDHLQRDADEDLVVVLPEVPHLDAHLGEEPRLHLRALQLHEERLGRGQRAGPDR